MVRSITSVRAVMAELREMADPSRLPGMSRVGIDVRKALGVSIPQLRALAERLGTDHALGRRPSRRGSAPRGSPCAKGPAQVTREQMEDWARGFASWDVCDQVCGDLFGATPHAYAAGRAWARRHEEFVKRAGFTLIAERTVRDNGAPDSVFERFFPAIRRGATDERNYVKKAVSWALRQISKRNRALNAKALEEAGRLRELDSRSARWIAGDVIRELRSDGVQRRLRAAREQAPARDPAPKRSHRR